MSAKTDEVASGAIAEKPAPDASKAAQQKCPAKAPACAGTRVTRIGRHHMTAAKNLADTEPGARYKPTPYE